MLLKKHLSYVIPSVLSMVAFYLYTLVDGIFVARYVGENALAAVTVSSSFVTVIFSCGVLFAIGCSTVTSIYRGRNDSDSANRVFTMSLLMVSALALFLSLFSFIKTGLIVNILKANSDISDYVYNYIHILSCFVFFYIVSYNFEVLLKADGYPNKSIIGVCLGAVFNLVLDPIFMGSLQMGIEGAALATGISQLVTFSFFFYHFLISGKSHYKFVKPPYPFTQVARLLSLGLADAVFEISPGIMVAFFNIRIDELLSTNGLVTFSVLMYVYNLVLMVMVGINQGSCPLLSYYYGKNSDYEYKTIQKYTRIISGILSLFSYIAVVIFADGIVGCYIETGSVNYLYTIKALKTFSLAFIFMGNVVVTSGFFSSREQPLKSLLISLLRGIILPLATLQLISGIFQADFIWYSCLLSELLSLVICLFMDKESFAFWNIK
ncbi:MAG: MATE family efflux transporter [Erysipelotrichaceae bacterium]